MLIRLHSISHTFVMYERKDCLEKKEKQTSDGHIDLRIDGTNNSVLQEASAQHIIEESDGILTSDKARKSLFMVLENPPQPNQALRKALKKHGEANPTFNLSPLVKR
jgi:uncharacterized protein (DUF1778 family)